MRNWIVLLILVLTLASCSNLPVPGPIDGEDGGEDDDAVATAEIPRAEPPTPTSLPATYTPAPVVFGGHLYIVDGRGRYGDDYLIHVVEAGDTLSKLCARYGVPIEDIARINRIRNLNHIEIGQSLKIPVPATSS